MHLVDRLCLPRQASIQEAPIKKGTATLLRSFSNPAH